MGGEAPCLSGGVVERMIRGDGPEVEGKTLVAWKNGGWLTGTTSSARYTFGKGLCTKPTSLEYSVHACLFEIVPTSTVPT